MRIVAALVCAIALFPLASISSLTASTDDSQTTSENQSTPRFRDPTVPNEERAEDLISLLLFGFLTCLVLCRLTPMNRLKHLSFSNLVLICRVLAKSICLLTRIRALAITIATCTFPALSSMFVINRTRQYSREILPAIPTKVSVERLTSSAQGRYTGSIILTTGSAAMVNS
jgi:hypothetical protein